MTLFPFPCRVQDGFEVGVLWLPVEHFLRASGVAHQAWRITRASRRNALFYALPDDPLCAGNNVLYRESVTVAEVEGIEARVALEVI